MKNRIKYLFVFTVPMAVLLSFQGGLLSFFGLFYAFVFIPGIELLTTGSIENHDAETEAALLEDRWFDYLVYFMVPLQYFLLFYFLYTVSTGSFTWWELMGMTGAMGTACGALGINVAHELGHRQKRSEQIMALLLLLTSQYMHFYIDHNRVHHKMVSTPEDPTSAIYGESLYAFLPRSIIGNWFASLNIARTETLIYLVIQLVFIAVITLVFGQMAGLCFIGAAFFGILNLEAVNYIEHYGLRRKKNPSGRYEKVLPKHSWNSNHPIGRIVLFELSRHSDHHANAHRKYQILRSFEEAPLMPTGYPGMMVLSMFPPLWFKVMNPRVQKLASA